MHTSLMRVEEVASHSRASRRRASEPLRMVSANHWSASWYSLYMRATTRSVATSVYPLIALAREAKSWVELLATARCGNRRTQLHSFGRFGRRFASSAV